MTRQDTIKILSLLSMTYRREYSEMTREEKETQITLWQTAFADMPFEKVSAAVQSYIFNDTTGYAPVIGKIKETLSKIQPDGVDEAKAWSLVNRACMNGLYNAKKEFAKLPPEVQRVVGSFDQIKIWAGMDAEYVQNVVQKQFKRDYREQMSRQRIEESAPDGVKSIISGIGMLPGGRA